MGKGDIMATLMAWLDDVPAGGATGFDAVNYEDVIEPTKGNPCRYMQMHISFSLTFCGEMNWVMYILLLNYRFSGVLDGSCGKQQ